MEGSVRMLGNSALKFPKKSCQRYGYLVQTQLNSRSRSRPYGCAHVVGAEPMKSYGRTNISLSICSGDDLRHYDRS